MRQSKELISEWWTQIETKCIHHYFATQRIYHLNQFFNHVVKNVGDEDKLASKNDVIFDGDISEELDCGKLLRWESSTRRWILNQHPTKQNNTIQ